jgi:hypothetical protein
VAAEEAGLALFPLAVPSNHQHPPPYLVLLPEQVVLVVLARFAALMLSNYPQQT